MKLLCLMFTSTLAAWASFVTTTTVYGPESNDNAYGCAAPGFGYVVTCDSIVFDIPQQQGLTSVTWTLQDTVNYGTGFYDIYDPIGTPFSFTWTEGIQGDLGVNSSITESASGTTENASCDFSACTSDAYGSITASGSADIAPFGGSGTLALTFTPFAIATGNDPSNDVFTGIEFMRQSVTLTLHETVDPPDPVPEPRWLGLALLSAVLFLRPRSSEGS